MRINHRAVAHYRTNVKGWTITRLAAASGVPQPNLSRIERGDENPTWEKLCAIADALGISDPWVIVAPDVMPADFQPATWPVKARAPRRKAAA